MRETHRNRDRIDLQLDSRQIVSFVIGSLVVLGVVFALGVMVGKQLAASAGSEIAAGSDPLAEIDAREKALADAAIAEVAVKEEEALTFEHELTRPKTVDPVIEPTRGAEPPAPKREEPVKVAEPKPAAEPPAEPKGRKGLADAFDKVAASPTGSGSLAVQVASLPKREDADRVVDKLVAKGFSAYVVSAEIPGKGTYYRVKVGSFETRDEANGALADIKAQAAMTGIVTSAR